jgi:hypothetical protein
MQVTLQQNAWKGLNYTVNYQWASAFADSAGNGNYATWDRHVAHGRDSNVRLQQITWYGTYDLPFGHGKQFASGANGITNAVIGGWQISSVLNWAGGLPFTLNYNERSTNLPESAPSYPSYASTGKMKTSLSGFQAKSNGTGQRTYYHKQVDNLVNPTVTNGLFKNPGPDTIGNVGKNTYFGPSFFTDDMAIAKTVNIHENWAVKFRMDAFNAFNHISPGNPGGNIESEGTITGGAAGYQPRQLMFSLRVQF